MSFDNLVKLHNICLFVCDIIIRSCKAIFYDKASSRRLKLSHLLDSWFIGWVKTGLTFHMRKNEMDHCPWSMVCLSFWNGHVLIVEFSKHVFLFKNVRYKQENPASQPNINWLWLMLINFFFFLSVIYYINKLLILYRIFIKNFDRITNITFFEFLCWI